MFAWQGGARKRARPAGQAAATNDQPHSRRSRIVSGHSGPSAPHHHSVAAGDGEEPFSDEGAEDDDEDRSSVPAQSLDVISLAFLGELAQQEALRRQRQQEGGHQQRRSRVEPARDVVEDADDDLAENLQQKEFGVDFEPAAEVEQQQGQHVSLVDGNGAAASYQSRPYSRPLESGRLDGARATAATSFRRDSLSPATARVNVLPQGVLPSGRPWILF